MPEIALIGGGSVGSLLASSLLSNHATFTWVVRNPLRRAELLQQLTLDQGDGALLQLATNPELIVEQPTEAIGHNWIILAVKAQQVLPLLAELSPYPGGKVLVVSNGIHEGPFHLGLLFGGAYLESEVVRTSADNRLIVGPLGGITDWSSELLNFLHTDWLSVEPTLDVEPVMWRKAALNCVVNPLTAILDCGNGALLELLESPLILALLNELSVVIYHASNQELLFTSEELQADLLQLVWATAGNSSSMREDLRHGRETEIDLLNGSVVKQARQYGLDSPLNESLVTMLRALTNRKRL